MLNSAIYFLWLRKVVSASLSSVSMCLFFLCVCKRCSPIWECWASTMNIISKSNNSPGHCNRWYQSWYQRGMDFPDQGGVLFLDACAMISCRRSQWPTKVWVRHGWKKSRWSKEANLKINVQEKFMTQYMYFFQQKQAVFWWINEKLFTNMNESWLFRTYTITHRATSIIGENDPTRHWAKYRFKAYLALKLNISTCSRWTDNKW